MRRAPLLATLLLLAPAAAGADVHPNSESGFAPGKAFQVGEVDNINTFNGSLVLTLPLGQSFPVGGGLGYGLTLVYNSTPWEFQQRIDPVTDVVYTQAFPSPRSNAGLGWRVSPGRLLEPHEIMGAVNGRGGVTVNDSNSWIYVAPDGSEHIFYDRLHEGDPEDPGDGGSAQNVTYTRDGSYLRMKVVGPAREIEFPDGTIHKFASDRRLVQIRNRFSGNTVSIAYTQPWTITDSRGRTQKVYFKTLPQDGGNVDVVDRVELTAFGGTTATYTFSYTPATIRRACPHDEDDDVMTLTTQVQLLTSVTLPDGSSYSMPSSDYVIDAPNSSILCLASGSIRGLKLPTLGKLEWSYLEYNFPSQSSTKRYRQKRVGVGTRKTLDASGNLLGQWTYTTSLTPSGIPGPVPIYEEMVNSTTDPLGNRREHYFSVYAGGSGTSSFLVQDYGLPFSRYTTDGAGRFLSARVYDSSGVLKRSTYVRYQRDQLSSVGDGFQDQLNINRREETSRTVHHDDGDRYTESNRSGFDGLGHYRTIQTGGNFPSADSRTAFVNYNPNAGTYELDANGLPLPGFTMLGSSSPWILGTFTEQKVTEGSLTERSLFCFNSATGFLERRRTLLSSAGIGARDVLVAYTADASGNTISESYHGAEAGGLSLTDTCSFTPPVAQYQINYTYAYGALATSQYTGVTFKSVDRTIDSSTGLASSSRDTAGLQTAFEYDALGRITWAMPSAGHDAWTEYVYTRATSASSLAQVKVNRRENGSKTAAVIVPSQIHFDALGRVWKELSFLPGNVWSVRETQYNGAGWKSATSEPYLLNTTPLHWTQLLNHDAFGRPKTVRPPDGSTHDVTFNYFGTRLVERTVKIGTSYSNGVVTETAAKTTEHYDNHGRLYKVAEPSGAAGSDVTTTYAYDAGNRLRHAKTEATVTQNRFFTYDGRGFLTSEIHPEKGVSGNGKVEYFNYDARGHAGRIVDGPNDLLYTFDAAERLTKVQETGGFRRTLKELSYDTAAGWGAGKLAAASRYNYPVLGTTTHTAQVTETYTYNGLGGRASKRDTAVTFNGSPAESFTQTFTWISLGDEATLGYPQCTHAGCAVPSPRTVTNGYTNHVLTSVASGGVTYATLSYHPNGMLNQVVHANGVTDTQAADPNGMLRPAAHTSTSGGATRWTTGTYSYDGAGNITKMGTSWFTYDKVNRLTTGTVFTGTTGGGTQLQQTYTFDPFGNLTAVGGNSGRSVPIDASTNRQNATGVSYDTAGNLTAWNGNIYEYDAFNQMWRMKSGAEEWLYIYTADGERVWSFKVGANWSRWTLRDLSGKVLREYNNAAGVWSVAEDYLYRSGQLLAAETPSGRKHFHLDHLGTPRLVTAAGSGGDFYTLTPCRVIDTRTQSAPLSAGETRTVSLVGSCGIPSTAVAVSINVTAVDATAQGELTGYPANAPRPGTSTISYPALINRANNAILRLGDGALAFFNNQASGTVHLIIDVNGYFTEGAGATLAYHVYYPFGEEATAFNQDTERMKFTGHERDLASLAGAGDDLDYMHARHCSPVTGRFLSFDPIGGNERAPQSWNRYVYVMGKSLGYIDPQGLIGFGVFHYENLAGGALETYYYGEAITSSAAGTGSLFVNTATNLSLSAMSLRGAVSSAIGAESRLRLGDFSAGRVLSLSGQGLGAFVDGVLPFIDPFEASGMVNPEEVGMQESKMIGEITRDVELALAASGSTVLFGKGTWINRGRWLRIGHSTHRKTRTTYFSLRGKVVDGLTGQSKAHIDLWSVFGPGR